MASNRTAYTNGWYARQMTRLRALRGNACALNPSHRITKKNPLEWAHVAPTGLDGRSRGRNQRILDVKLNPTSYWLLCRSCHRRLDLRLQGVV